MQFTSPLRQIEHIVSCVAVITASYQLGCPLVIVLVVWMQTYIWRCYAAAQNDLSSLYYVGIGWLSKCKKIENINFNSLTNLTIVGDNADEINKRLSVVEFLIANKNFL